MEKFLEISFFPSSFLFPYPLKNEKYNLQNKKREEAHLLVLWCSTYRE